MTPAGEHHQPDEGHDEAEERDKHDPALRVVRHHVGAGHQDPHQTAEDLQGQQRDSRER